MKHNIRQKKGECSPTNSKPRSTASRPFKSPTLYEESPPRDLNSDGAFYFERKRPLPIKELEEELEDDTRR